MSSQGAQDAMADARTLLALSTPRVYSALWNAQDAGSRAVVAALDGNDFAGHHAEWAAHYAFKAVPGLRG
jgi:hypothetical protein